jgi:hypothetical protein
MPRPLYKQERKPVRILKEAGWATGPVWRVREISPSPWFDPRTFQPVASRYTDWAIPAPVEVYYFNINNCNKHWDVSWLLQILITPWLVSQSVSQSIVRKNISCASFDVSLTVHLSITLANDHLEYKSLRHLLQSSTSTCFEQYLAHPQEDKLY